MKVPNITIPVTVRSRDELVFEGQVRAITGYDVKGAFDVLSHHSNLIAIIKSKLVLYLVNGSTKEVSVENGVLQVVRGKVNVFLGVKRG